MKSPVKHEGWVAEQPRNLPQNALLHAVCTDISKQKKWADQRIDTEGWKRLLVDAWSRETGRSPGKMVPSLDGQSVVVLNISTRKLKKKDFAELMEWVFSYCDMNDIKVTTRGYEGYPEAQDR